MHFMKKKDWKVLAFVCIFSLIISMLPQFPSNAAPSSTAQQIQDAEREKEETEKKKEEKEKEKDQKEDQIENLQIKQGNMREKLASLNEELTEAGEYLKELEDKIAAKNIEITATQEELELAKAEEEKQYDSMKKRVQSMYEQPSGTYIEMLANAETFADFLNVADYILMISDYDNKMFELRKELKEDVAKKEKKLLQEKAELDELKELALAEQDRIAGLIQTTTDYVTRYTSEIGSAQKELSEIEKEIEQKEKEIAEQEKDIEALKKKYEEELAMSQQASKAERRDISEVVFEENDRYLLANLIYCEAGGESYEGQLAVGAVVINRVLSSCYPDTVTGVIYQRKQFSPVASGRLALALAQNKATASCYTAADEAMTGVTNVGNCYYFRTPIPGLVGIQIGGHIFY